MALEFELRTWAQEGALLLEHTWSPFALVILSDRVFIFAWDGFEPWSSYLNLCSSQDYKCELPYPDCLLRYGLINFFA
jgi:hypothetical protein